MSNHITLRDIAKESGVSLATVSRALRDDPRTAKATKKKVKDVADRLGYRPDPALQVLIERRWHGRRMNEGMNIAYVYNGKGINAESCKIEYRRFRETAQKLGYTLIAEDLSKYPNVEKVIKRMETKGVTGVVFTVMADAPYPIDTINERFASVSVNVSSWKPECPVVMHDEFQGVERAWHRLNQLGYQRIGTLLQDYPQSYSMDQRLGAVFCRQHYVQPTKNRIPFHLHPKEAQPNDKKIRTWIERHKPQVILGDDHEELGLLQSMGYKIPEDFAFATINMWNTDLVGEIAGYFRDNVNLFERALKLINMMVRSGNTGSDQGDLIEMVKGNWVDGASLPDLNDKENSS
ncbi:LacI family DNA-binding transcriptional regulator [Coraliomargarita algicola]|uniref:LacI family DNA-binding transcriptional regulator n=1 Tax=Coraliomargarita algicola TaxID=3092156 RepID=A0ABZ0RJA7_9BACT|nr:LacI family DNA-binding transcriptional regulator [Coraliomargarita sp. J2-16]WPJ95168.1 LacI family DNA-binding transcriptional regulator [Coraliomargarita sp. J2-16]